MVRSRCAWLERENAMAIRELWTVEAGSYSDHAVLGVFEDEATATAWRDAIVNEAGGWHRDAFLGHIQMVPTGIAPYRVSTWQKHVELWDDGRIETRGPWENVKFPICSLNGPPPHRPKVRYVRAPCHGDMGGRLEVIGATLEAVEKVASDRIAMWKAGAWAGKQFSEIDE